MEVIREEQVLVLIYFAALLVGFTIAVVRLILNK